MRGGGKRLEIWSLCGALIRPSKNLDTTKERHVIGREPSRVCVELVFTVLAVAKRMIGQVFKPATSAGPRSRNFEWLLVLVPTSTHHGSLLKGCPRCPLNVLTIRWLNPRLWLCS